MTSRTTHPPATQPLPPGVTARVMRAVDLRPGHAVRIAGLGTFNVSASPRRLPDDQALVPLAWENLALIVHPAAPLDALATDPKPTYRAWQCPRCAGSGLWQPEPIRRGQEASNAGM